MKKQVVVALFAAAFLFSMASVSAFWGSVEFAVRDLIEIIRQFLAPLLEVLIGDYSSSEFFFAKVLLLVLLFVLVQFALNKVPTLEGKKAVINTVAAVVSILAVRYIQDNDLVNLILLPYGTLGIALTAIIPFLIYFYFVHNALLGPTGRRLSWFFFAIVFCALWYTRSNDIGGIGNQIYGWTLAAVVIAFVFDKNFHEYFSLGDLNAFKRKSSTKRIASLQAEYVGLDGVHTHEAHERRKEILKEIEKLKKSS